MSGMTVVEAAHSSDHRTRGTHCMLVTTAANRSVKLVCVFVPTALQILSAALILQQFLTELPVQFITMVEVIVIMHWRLRSKAGALL